MTDATATTSAGITTRGAERARAQQEFITGPLREDREDSPSVAVIVSSWLNEVIREEKEMPKDEKQVKGLIEALESYGYDPQSYSGRGMYGKECVSVHDGSIWDIAKDLFSEGEDGAFNSLPEPRQDQLGLGVVLYWPSYEWPKDAA